MKNIHGAPQWNNHQEYPIFNLEFIQPHLNDLESDIAPLIEISNKIEKKAQEDQFLIQELQQHWPAFESFYEKARNLLTYCHCELSTNSQNLEIKKLYSIISKFTQKQQNSLSSIFLFIKELSDVDFQFFLNHEETKSTEFYFLQQRALSTFFLKKEEEQIIEKLANNGGINAWGKMYTDLSAQLSFQLEGSDEATPISKARSMMESSHEETRKKTFEATQKTWESFSDVANYTLNNVAAWRNSIDQEKSKKGTYTFLTPAFHEACVQEKSIQSMFQAVKKVQPDLHKIISVKATLLNKKQCDAWDMSAGCPFKIEKDSYSFSEAIELIKNAFSEFSVELSDFVQLMVDQEWIDAAESPARRPGGYCTSFSHSKTPRIFMTYTGSLSDITTLAHEIGHAYHSWVMKDLNLYEKHYPMTLAETASVFCETLLRDYLSKHGSADQKKLTLWSELRAAEAFCLNIPTRYDFEKSFYEVSQKRELNSSETSDLMEAAFQENYKDSYSSYNKLFWASKLHFHTPDVRFYNFPYTFGYLFSLGLYSLKDSQSNFPEFYKKILRNTGKMTAEELCSKHLNLDLTQESFWEKSLTGVLRRLQELNEFT